MPQTVWFKSNRRRFQLRGPEFDSLSIHTTFIKNKLRVRQTPFLCVCCSFIPSLAVPKRRQYLYRCSIKCSDGVLSSYIFVTSAIISALVMTTTILRDVTQLYSDIKVKDVSKERAAFDFTAEVLRVEWWVSSSLGMDTTRYSGKVGKFLPRYTVSHPRIRDFSINFSCNKIHFKASIKMTFP